MTEGFCCVARDDLFIGGKTEDECIDNWERVLVKLNANNLKLSPGKVRIMLQDTEVFGHRVKDGKMRPSDHIVTSLGKTSMEELKTVRQVNSWKGLYKTLIRHLPHLASQMAPFDRACASKTPTSTFDWSRPGMVAAFNGATRHPEEVRETYLPHPDEQLVLMPDTSTSNLCSGRVLYTQRITGEGKTWLPVQYASARPPKYMATWTPCEQEAMGSAASRFCIQNIFCIYRTITEPYRTITEPFVCISDGSVYTELLQNHWLAALYLDIHLLNFFLITFTQFYTIIQYIPIFKDEYILSANIC